MPHFASNPFKQIVILAQSKLTCFSIERTMPLLKSISIENFRSIGESPVEVAFADGKPLILIGENNSGKSNIIRAIELMFGEFHPKYKKLDDHDYFNRDTNNRITIKADISGLQTRLGWQKACCSGFRFSCQKNAETDFVAIQMEDGGENAYVPNQLREELLCVVVNSEQNLSYQLSYATKYTLLSRVTKDFHDKLVESEDRVSRLKQLFESIQETFREVDEFSVFASNMSSIAGDMLSNMSHALQFDFSAYDPSNYFRTLRVHPCEGGATRAFEELGTGQQQILALSFAHAYAKSFLGQGLIFILDEPESHLHPLAQKWLAKQMFKMAEDGLQLIITTHSPYFIDLEYLDNIYLVRKDEQTYVKNVTARKLAEFCRATGVPRALEGTIVPFYAAHSMPQILNGFFANRILLVEGLTEELALPIYFAQVGLDILKEGIAIISVGGKGNLAKWWRFFSAFEIPTFICFDNDARSDQGGTRRRDALRAIGIPANIVEEALVDQGWRISERFSVFGQNFEQTMSASFAEYDHLNTTAIAELGDSKPIVAKAVAQRLCVNPNQEDQGWESLRTFAIALREVEPIRINRNN